MVDPNAPRLGDTPTRDYGEKLRLFNAFAAPELKAAIDALKLAAGARVLDAGCGSGDALTWLHAAVQPGGTVLGVDVSQPHVEAAQRRAVAGISVCQGDICALPVDAHSLDLIWSCNAINHVHDPLPVLKDWQHCLRPEGQVALGQSSFLPDMLFAWDARLERLVNEAVRHYYRDRYRLTEASLGAIRALFGLLKRAGFLRVTAKTFIIERTFPLDCEAVNYLQRAIFQGTFSEKLAGYLDASDYAELSRLMDPKHAEYALHRPDFHFLQTFTLVTGEADPDRGGFG